MYTTWSVTELKAELERRGASLRGEKADLIERLKLYDKNYDFGYPEYLELDEEEESMALPPNESFTDINSDTILPPVNNSQIKYYLNCTEHFLNAALDLYKSRHLVTARASVVGDSTYVKGCCRKSKEKLIYVVDVKLDQFGNPLESQCECPAGSGVNSVCQHVAVLMLGLEHMTRDKQILTNEVSTQKLQQFLVPEVVYSGTPVRAEKLPKKRSGVHVILKPYPTEKLDVQNYNRRIRNLVFKFKNSTMPMKQLYEPAKSKEDINNIEISTRDQTIEL